MQEQAGSGDCDLSFGRHLCDIQQGQQPVFGLPDLQSGETAQGATASQVRPYADIVSCLHVFVSKSCKALRQLLAVCMCLTA